MEIAFPVKLSHIQRVKTLNIETSELVWFCRRSSNFLFHYPFLSFYIENKARLPIQSYKGKSFVIDPHTFILDYMIYWHRSHYRFTIFIL